MICTATRARVATIAISALLGACSSDATTVTPAANGATVATPKKATAVAATTASTPAVQLTAASPTTTLAGITPKELVDRWVGPPRTIGTLGTGTGAAFVDISDGFLVYNTGIAENPKAFGSDLVATGDNSIEVKIAGDVLDCFDGDVGHYRWSLSPQATTLTLTATDDTCAARQAALEGKWTHTACMVEGRDCVGVVEAGTYSTNRWNPYGGFTYGEVTFTLPDGWAVGYDSQAAFFLRSANDYAKLGNDSAWGISSWADVAAAAPDKPDCGSQPVDQPDPNVGTGAANIAAWMVALPSLKATRSTMTIGGLPAEVVDAEIAAGAKVCNWGVILITSRTSKPDPFNFGIAPNQHMRIILVDVVPDRTVAIFVDDSQHPGFDALEKAAMPIVASFVFSPTPPTTLG
jgi:hypothetical protein